VVIARAKTHALVDSGATGYFIDKEFIKKHGLKTKRLLFPITVRNVDDTENIAVRIREKVEVNFTILERRMKAVFYITTLGKQAIILGLPWVECADPDISWRNRTLHWRNHLDEVDAGMVCPSHEPTYNLTISYIKGVATEETQLQWVKSRMNKTSLFAYNKEKDETAAMQKKTLEELVPKEFHEYLSVFSDQEAS
jgi:hypothetical protein